MRYPFQLHDWRVELFRWEARYVDRDTGEEESRGFPTQAEAQAAMERWGTDGQGTVTALDVSTLEWLEGLEVDSFDEALAIYELGEAAYRAKLADAAQKSPDQLRADVDFISAMTGVRL